MESRKIIPMNLFARREWDRNVGHGLVATVWEVGGWDEWRE